MDAISRLLTFIQPSFTNVKGKTSATKLTVFVAFGLLVFSIIWFFYTGVALPEYMFISLGSIVATGLGYSNYTMIKANGWSSVAKGDVDPSKESE